MEAFIIPVADRALVRPYQFDFQTQVAVIANKIMGQRGVRPNAIPHHKGGVQVNGELIVIDDNHVFALSSPGPSAATPEETATVQALVNCIATFKLLTAQGRAPHDVFAPAPPHIILSDPLKQFFRHVP
jgi:hypothetical protein